MRVFAQLVLLLVAPCVAHAYTFGGFDADETSYLKRGPDDRVCAPAPETRCTPIDKKGAMAFTKPARSRRFTVTAADEKTITLREGDRTLGEVTPGGRVVSVNTNLFVSPGGGLVAVEYEVAAPAGRAADVVVFALGAAPPPAPSPPTAGGVGPPPTAPSAPTGKTAYARALDKGGVWEQRLVACDQAGVHLVLKKTRRFDIQITTKCQGQKNTTSLAGSFATEGEDALILQFENEESGLERLECRFATCTDVAEDCLTCSQDDVTFTMQVVRR